MSNPTELPDLDKLEALARAATPGPWAWWTSNSVLRLSADDGIDGGVLHAYSRRSHADICCGESDRAFIAAANPAAVLALIAIARRAQPEGEAPQADDVARKELLLALQAVLDTCATKSGAPKMSHLGTLAALNTAIDVATRAAPAAQHADSGALEAADERVDAIVTGLYHRFKGWSKRGFGADDVTWCEVKADVIALIAAQSQGAPALPTARAGDPDVDAAQWAEVFYRNAETFTVRDLGIVRAAWKEATRRAAQLDGGQGEGEGE